jgi:NADH:ubiquinone oxidoreductase subunit
MTISTKIFTKLRGKLIGTDEFGNKYYEDKKKDASGKNKRWVMYNGLAEPSKVPPNWHGWLHYTTNEVPDEFYKWQKPYTPNLSGTKNAYFPAGHEAKGGVRNKVSSDYEAWQPND